MSIPKIDWLRGHRPVVVVRLVHCLSWLTLGVVVFSCVSALWRAAVATPAVKAPASESIFATLSARLVPRREESGARPLATFPAQAPVVSNFSEPSVVPGQVFVITGSNFAPNASDNIVTFPNSPPIAGLSSCPLNSLPGRAQVISVNSSSTELTVITPYGAASGTVTVEVAGTQGVSTQTIAVPTSVSGYVLDDVNNQGINGATVQFSPTLSRNTSPQGVFMLLGVLPGTARRFEVNGATATPPYGSHDPKALVLPGRDNHYCEFMKLHRLPGTDTPVGMWIKTSPASRVAAVGQASAISAQVAATGQALAPRAQSVASPKVKILRSPLGEAELQIPQGATFRFPNGATSGKLNIAVFERERAPAPLPLSHYSSAIVQIMPFGVTINPGAKLIFPNRDRIPANAEARLFRFDQTDNSPTLGSFVDAGPAKVTTDGQFVETDANAIRETSYYFVSMKWPTATLVGRVTQKDGRPAPRAIVIARGQFTFSDGNGNFTLRGAPVLGPNDRVIVETSVLRPDGHVDIAERANVPVAPGEITKINPDLILSQGAVNHPPAISAPVNLSLRVGEVRDFSFKVSDPDQGQRALVSVAGAAFAAIRSGDGESYALRLTPGGNDAGDYRLTVTAVDSLGVRSLHRIALRVNKE